MRPNKGILTNPEAYRNASKNMRNYVGLNGDSRKILQQGLILEEKQNIHNVEQIIKYIQSDRFKQWVEGEIASYMARNPIEVNNEEWPEPEPGPPGQDGRDGNDGRDGVDGRDGQDGQDGKDGKPGIEDFGNLYFTVNGSTTGVYGPPYDPTDVNGNTFNINLSEILPDNPFYPMKVQNFEANIPNGFNLYDGQLELQSDTQVILVKKMIQNANGIRFYNMNANLNNERVLFVHMSSDSPVIDNLQVFFSIAATGGISMNARLQEANLVFISRDYCMYQSIGAGGQM